MSKVDEMQDRSEGQGLSVVIVDGIAVNGETGEVLYPEGNPMFEVCDQKSAEWFGQKLLEKDAQIEATKIRRQVYLNNVEQMLDDMVARRDAFVRRYGGQLATFAKSQLPKTAKGELKSKTWKCPFLTVAFRKSREKIELRDPEAALSWSCANAPEAVKTEIKILDNAQGMEWVRTIQVPEFIQVHHSVMRGSVPKMSPEEYDAAGFSFFPSEETVEIETGAEKLMATKPSNDKDTEHE